MICTDNYLQISRASLLSAVLMMALVIGNSSWAVTKEDPKQGFDPSTGNWVDTNLVTWTPISTFKTSYLEAEKFCKEKKMQGGFLAWKLPTPELADSYFMNVVKPAKQKNGAVTFGEIWLSAEGVDLDNQPHYQVVNFDNGYLNLLGDAADSSRGVACVATLSDDFFDGKLTWSKATDKLFHLKDGKAMCAGMNNGSMGKGWALPTLDQISGLAMTLTNNDNAIFNKLVGLHWTFGTFWTQEFVTKNTPYNYYVLFQNNVNYGARAYVMCVR